MATQIQKNTARLMLKKLQAKLDRLYMEQEAQKPQGQPDMGSGMPQYHWG
jgi:hypothetical protein